MQWASNQSITSIQKQSTTWHRTSNQDRTYISCCAQPEMKRVLDAFHSLSICKIRKGTKLAPRIILNQFPQIVKNMPPQNHMCIRNCAQCVCILILLRAKISLYLLVTTSSLHYQTRRSIFQNFPPRPPPSLFQPISFLIFLLEDYENAIPTPVVARCAIY